MRSDADGSRLQPQNMCLTVVATEPAVSLPTGALAAFVVIAIRLFSTIRLGHRHDLFNFRLRQISSAHSGCSFGDENNSQRGESKKDRVRRR
jgi:hypothetical protein